MKKLLVLFLSLSLISCGSTPEEQATLTSEELSRIGVDLQSPCYQHYAVPKLNSNQVNGYGYIAWKSVRRVFVIGNTSTGGQYCSYSKGNNLPYEELSNNALSNCNNRMPNGTGCQIYAINSNIVYKPKSFTPAKTEVLQSNSNDLEKKETPLSPLQDDSNRLADAKNKCQELGFKASTEGFGKCILRLTK